MLEKQMKGVPQDQQDKILGMLEKDPAFFETIAKEIQAEMGKGKAQQQAALSVMMKHKEKIQELMK